MIMTRENLATSFNIWSHLMWLKAEDALSSSRVRIVGACPLACSRWVREVPFVVADGARMNTLDGSECSWLLGNGGGFGFLLTWALGGWWNLGCWTLPR